MSTDALHDVTQALHDLIKSQMPGRTVTLLPPGDDPPSASSGVNLYMYRINESAYLRNSPYPGDRAGGTPRPWPALSLEVFYLITPFGPAPDANTGADESQRALGEAMLALHQNPVLNHTHIAGFDSDSLPAYLLNSYEDIKIRLHPVTLDELSKIWSTIGKPYRLSVAYEVTLVQVTPTTPADLNGGIVLRTGLEVEQFAAPRLLAVSPRSAALATLVGSQAVAQNLTLSGFGFAPQKMSVAVTVGGVSVATVGVPADRALVVALPTRPSAGPDLDVVIALGRRLSQPLTFTALPWISSSTPIRTALDPGVNQALNVTLDGSGIQSAADARIFGPAGALVAAIAAGPGPHQMTVKLPPASAVNQAAPAGQLVNGQYSIRARLADNSLSNPRDLEVIPFVASTSFNSATNTLTVNGARLDGANVHLLLDAADYALGSQSNGGLVSHKFVRAPTPGAHLVAVNVDGHSSHEIAVTV